jgi:TRAP-type C4-dicarboxylate transport system substrate-binding protein
MRTTFARRSFLAASASALTLALAPRSARATEVIKIATLAPKASMWGKVYRVWEKAVDEKSGGRLKLEIYYNGAQGDEGAIVGKMKAGQLDAAAVTSVGLSKIYRPILALQIPGLFRTWEKLDHAREAMKGEFEKGLLDAGFTLGGWGDVGIIRMMTAGFEVRTPEDLRGQKPMTWRDDVIGPTLYQIIGGVTSVPLSAPEVLGAIGTGAINVISAPALVAEQLQWAPKFSHISAEGVVMAIGGMVFRTARLDALPADLLEILKSTGKVAGAALSARIRSEDDAAFARLKSKMTVVTLTEDEKKKWAATLLELGKRLAQGTFSPDLIKKLVELAK